MCHGLPEAGLGFAHYLCVIIHCAGLFSNSLVEMINYAIILATGYKDLKKKKYLPRIAQGLESRRVTAV